MPLLVVAPALFWGNLPAVLERGGAIFLLPAFTLLMAPGAVAGHLASRIYGQRRDAWRFAAGLFFGASVSAGLLMWASTADVALPRRLSLAVFGGPFLAGFWLWLGALLGLGHAYRNRD